MQPTLAFHHGDPFNPVWELAASARYIVNFENDDTGYTSGNEIVVDDAAGRFFGKTRIGVVGYLLEQVTDDEGPGVASDGHRGRAFAIGPSIGYRFNPGLELSASYQDEIYAENRSQSSTLWINLAAKF